MADTNGDGLRENTSARSRDARLALDAVARLLRDAGRQQRHAHRPSPIRSACRARTSASRTTRPTRSPIGTAVDAVLATQTGANNTPRDVVVTDGPMIDVHGRQRSPRSAAQIAVGRHAGHADGHDHRRRTGRRSTRSRCSRTRRPTASRARTTTRRSCRSSAGRSRTLATLDAERSVHAGRARARGDDRQARDAPRRRRLQALRGDRHGHARPDRHRHPRRRDRQRRVARVPRARRPRHFPAAAKGDTITDTTMPALLERRPSRRSIRLSTGTACSAEAVTAPVFVDFDGGGYRAPFAP